MSTTTAPIPDAVGDLFKGDLRSTSPTAKAGSSWVASIPGDVQPGYSLHPSVTPHTPSTSVPPPPAGASTSPTVAHPAGTSAVVATGEAGAATAEKGVLKRIGKAALAKGAIGRVPVIGTLANGAFEGYEAYEDFKRGDTHSGYVNVVKTVGVVAVGAAVAVAGVGFWAGAAALTAGSYAVGKAADALMGDGKTDAQHQAEYKSSLAAYKKAVVAEHLAGAGASKAQHDEVAQARAAYVEARGHVTKESEEQRQAVAMQWNTQFIAESDKQVQLAAEKQAAVLTAQVQQQTARIDAAYVSAQNKLEQQVAARAESGTNTPEQQGAINAAAAGFLAAREATLRAHGKPTETAEQAQNVMVAIATKAHSAALERHQSGETRTAAAPHAATPITGNHYHVEHNDSLSGIAARLAQQDSFKGVDPMALAALLAAKNGVHDVDRIQEGSNLALLSREEVAAGLQQLQKSGLLRDDGTVAYADIKGQDLHALLTSGSPTRVAKRESASVG